MGEKTPTWAELIKAQTRLKDVLDRVINGGETVEVEENGEKVFVIIPYDAYFEMKNKVENWSLHVGVMDPSD